MTFTPALPLSGISGWQFLQRTQEAQFETFEKSPQLAREVAHFQENIWKITSAEELVNDRQLFQVALGAFGLEDEIDKKFFIQKALQEGTDDPGSFANSLVDPRYRKMSEAFGFGNLAGSNTALSDFSSNIVAQYKERQFEVAVGDSNNALRLAMNFKREISEYANASDPDGTAWFSLMGSTPMREVMEAALGLPSQFGSLDVDLQQETFRDKARTTFGDSSLAVFNDPEMVSKAINSYLAREQINAGPSALTAGAGALQLLQNSGLGAGGLSSLLQSNAI